MKQEAQSSRSQKLVIDNIIGTGGITHIGRIFSLPEAAQDKIVSLS